MTEERIVNCIKLSQELPGLSKPPFSGAVGQEIFEKISAKAWAMWKDDMQIKIINEYRLNMGKKEDYNMLVEQMMLFLNLKSGETFTVEDPIRGKAR